MHPFFSSALVLLLLVPQSARAQASLPTGFVDAAAAVDGLVVDMRYFGSDNFVGERIDGYERPRCVLSAPAANALAAVQRGLAVRGLGLKVFDCYRPQRAVANFVRWAQRIDEWAARQIPSRADASLHTETLGSVIDRLAIAWVRTNSLISTGDTRERAQSSHEAGAHLYDSITRG